MNPPKHIPIELEAKDVRADVASALTAMRKIRDEAIRNNNFESSVREEYLHLAVRLGSYIRDREELGLIEQGQNVLAGSFDPTNYDILQQGSIAEQHPQFADDLNMFTIAALGDLYCREDDAYHVLQALKYLTSPADDHDKHKEACLMIRPFQTPAAQQLRGWKERLSRLFGYEYGVDSRKGLEITLGDISLATTDLLTYLRDHGYITVKGSLSKERFNDLKLNEGKKEQIDDPMVRLTLRNIEGRGTNHVDVFAEHAQIPPEIERNLEYRIGSPSSFGKGVKESFAINECDYAVLAKEVLRRLAEIAYVEVPLGLELRSARDFERFVEDLYKAVGDCLFDFEDPKKKFPYKKGDEVIVLRRLGARNRRNNDEFYHGASLPLQTKASVLRVNWNEGSEITIKSDIGQVGEDTEYRVIADELTPSLQAKKRLVDKVLEEARSTYDKKNLGPKVELVCDPEKEILFYRTQQHIAGYEKGTFMFLHPGKRTIVCAFNKGSFNGMDDFGKRLLSSEDPQEDTKEYFGAQSDMPYIHVMQFEQGEKVQDFEVRQ